MKKRNDNLAKGLCKESDKIIFEHSHIVLLLTFNFQKESWGYFRYKKDWDLWWAEIGNISLYPS